MEGNWVMSPLQCGNGEEQLCGAARVHRVSTHAEAHPHFVLERIMLGTLYVTTCNDILLLTHSPTLTRLVSC